MADFELCSICKTNEEDEWVQCDVCELWSHYGCLRLPPKYIASLVEFHCEDCAKTHGPSIEPRVSKRQRLQLNYAALNEGIVEIERTHPHARWFGTARFNRGPFPTLTGHDIPHILEMPVLIPRKYKDTLGLTVPDDLTLATVVDLLGRDRTLPVMDVVTQNVLPGWTLGRWATYVENKQDREQTLNLISLEFTGTPLQDKITRPAYVRKVDLVDRVWPEASQRTKPKVSHYCLSSVMGSYTDFHVDFGGSSVFYHVVSGHKTFLFVPPTAKNLKAYERWCKSDDQSSKFFPDLVSECWRLDFGPGDTILLPSGWIHAVHTPDDALVIGGNFLTLDNLHMELGINHVEMRTKVPTKFAYPGFRAVLWYTAAWLLRRTPQQLAEEHITQAVVDELAANLLTAPEGRPRDISADVAAKLADLRLDQLQKEESPRSVKSEPKPVPKQQQSKSPALKQAAPSNSGAAASNAITVGSAELFA